MQMDFLNRLLTMDIDPKTGKDPAIERIKGNIKLLPREVLKAALKVLVFLTAVTLSSAISLIVMAFLLRTVSILLHLLFRTPASHP